MHKRTQFKVDSLSHLLSYILGHRPDEFGLLPDPEGFVPYKDLLQAIHEESGWGYVRQGHIQEVLYGRDRSLFDAAEDRIRAVERRWNLDLENPPETLPKLLYAAVRRRAHAHVMERGLRPERFAVLSGEPDMALRIGSRKDPRPVLLEIHAAPARDQGVPFFPFGQLYLAREIAPRFITGPPVEEQEEGAQKEEKREGEKPARTPAGFAPGTFLLDARRDPDLKRRIKGRKAKGWKEESRKLRKRRDA
ncbi:MAG: RNA 2'-phosphotransferase [Thermodesulfobacteriota bacterium]